MPMPDYRIQGVPQLQQKKGPLEALTDFGKSKALSAGLEAAFPGGGIAAEAAQEVIPTFFEEGGKVPWWKSVANKVIGEDAGKIKAARAAARKHIKEGAKKAGKQVSPGDIGSVLGSFFEYGGSVARKPMYQRMGGMTPGPLGMSDMLEAGKGKDVSKVVYKKKGGDIEDQVEIAYHAPLAAKPKGE